MKSIKLAISVSLLSLGFLAQAQSLYDILVSNQGVDYGYGQITVKNGFAISGFFDATNFIAVEHEGVFPGNYFLAGGTTNYPNYLISYSKPEIEYDNAVYFSSNPQYPNTNLLLDWYGLCFVEPIHEGSLFPPAPLNLFATNDDGIVSYAILGDGNEVMANIEVTIIPAPEPSSVAVIAFALVPVGAIFYRRRMVRRSEAVVLLLKRLKQEKSVYTFGTNYLHIKRTETSAPVSVVSGGERLLSRILLSVFG